MMMHEPLAFVGLRGTLLRDVSLARYTTWRAGGNADLLYTPADRDDLAQFVRGLPATLPVTTLGLGSNVLVRDGGIRGAVILMHDPGAVLAVADGMIYADAGVASPKLARFAAMHGCADAEFLAGIPGTVGGALAMNAGCYGGETWRHVARVETLARACRFRHRLSQRAGAGWRGARRAVHRRVVPLSAGRRRHVADADQGAARSPDRDAAAFAAQCRQRVPQPARRSCRAADRVLRPQGLCDRRRARVRTAREFHRQSR